MALYEHVFLARQDVSNAQVEALTKEFTDLIEQGGGKVTKSEYWGVKGLAYKIKKSRKAHFSLLNLDAPPAAVAEMERRMGLSTEVLRFLTIKVEAHETEPSVMMRKSDRDERGDRGSRRLRRRSRRRLPRRWRRRLRWSRRRSRRWRRRWRRLPRRRRRRPRRLDVPSAPPARWRPSRGRPRPRVPRVKAARVATSGSGGEA